MTGGKTKILKSKKRSVKKETPIQELETLVRKDDAHITSELHYFKGLSIMITVLIVLVFFTFGCLFSALYWEVKGMSQAMQQYIEDTHEYLLNSTTVTDTTDSLATTDEKKTEDWLVFEKFGMKISFPNTWSYESIPSEKRINFYYNGLFPKVQSEELGSFDVYYETDDYSKTGSSALSQDKTSVAGIEAVEYIMPDGNGVRSVIVLPQNGKFVQIHIFTGIKDEVLRRFEFTK